MSGATSDIYIYLVKICVIYINDITFNFIGCCVIGVPYIFKKSLGVFQEGNTFLFQVGKVPAHFLYLK